MIAVTPSGIPAAPSGLMFLANPIHGLTPMATSSRPSGTEIPNSQPCGDLAATRLPDVAMGVSPWDRNCGSLIPGGTTANPIHGLTPMATSSRPSGTEIPNRQPCGDLAATRLADVALGVSPWDRNCGSRSRGWTTGNPSHGLTPMATSSRPSGTRIQNRPPRLVAELYAQFAESAKLEEAIKANLRGLGYGG